MTQTVTIAQKFCGPPGVGNGGYTCGLLDEQTDFVSEVTLWKPPPLDTPMQLLVDGQRAEMYEGTTLVASAKPGKINLKAPAPPPANEVQAAGERYLGLRKELPFPTCFVCGVQREIGDGLRIFTGKTGVKAAIETNHNGAVEREVFAAPWVPAEDLADKRGKVAIPYMWGAMDCPSAFAIMGERPLKIVLGRMTAHILQPIKVGDSCSILSWSEGNDGRKLYGGSAIYGSRQELCAVAKTTWFRIP